MFCLYGAEGAALLTQARECLVSCLTDPACRVTNLCKPWRSHGASLFSCFCLFSCFFFFFFFYQRRTTEHFSRTHHKISYQFSIIQMFCWTYGVIGVEAALIKRKTRRWGKQAGTLVKLRQRKFRMPLPSIHLANLRFLPNKTDKLLLLSRTNKDF